MIALKIEMDEKELQELILGHLSEQIGMKLALHDIQIQVKSKSNYKGEWESAAIRAIVDKKDYKIP